MMRCLVFVTFIFLSSSLFSQEKYTLSGYIRDASNGEDLIGATIMTADFQYATNTNIYGFYSITLPSGVYDFTISSVGYTSSKQSIKLNSDQSFNLELSPKTIIGKKAIILGDKAINIDGSQMGRENIQVDKIKSLPALLGEVDILKTIQLLPGIQAAGEGNSGFFVRGGGADQNLILLDNAIVYNPSHLFGFFSVFNADAIKDIEVYKGGMPANYGGRVSSVLDINMYDGNKKEFKLKGGLGLISSRLLLEGPIIKDKASFMVSARRTYVDVLLRPIQKNSDNQLGYYFYDANMKLNYRITDKDQVFLSAYLGKDVFNFDSEATGFNIRSPWGNSTVSARWNHLFNDKLFMNTAATYTKYDFTFGVSQSDFNFSLLSNIRDWGLKTQLNYFPNPKHNIKGGIDYIYHKFTPSTAEASSGEVDFDLGEEENIFSHEASIYLQDDFELSKKWKFHAGIRLSMFAHVGPYTRYTLPQSANTIGGIEDPIVEKFATGDILKTYINPEPRFNLRYKTGTNSSLKASYTHNYQYLHLTSTSASSLPTDIWFPSTDRVKPQFGRQVALGYFKNFRDNSFETSVEVYYKWLENLIEFRPGALPEDNVNNNIDNNLVFGSGTSFGAEFFIKKSVGDWTGWIAYTLSKTDRTFDDILYKPYPSKFDRRHDLSIIGNYTFNERWKIGGAFVYATGNSITVPEARYFIEGKLVEVYGEKNAFRMPSYHRLDFSATWYPSKRKKKVNRTSIIEENEALAKQKRKISSHWVFGVYNLYNRQNPYFIYFGYEGNLQEGALDLNAYQVSLFPTIPSVTWNFEF